MPLDETPNTLGYLLLGYAFLLGLPLLYVVSLALRQRNQERDANLLQSLEPPEPQPPG